MTAVKKVTVVKKNARRQRKDDRGQKNMTAVKILTVVKKNDRGQKKNDRGQKS